MKKKFILMLCKLFKVELFEKQQEQFGHTHVNLIHKAVEYKEIISEMTVYRKDFNNEAIKESLIRRLRESLINEVFENKNQFVEIIQVEDFMTRDIIIKARLFIGKNN